MPTMYAAALQSSVGVNHHLRVGYTANSVAYALKSCASSNAQSNQAGGIICDLKLLLKSANDNVAPKSLNYSSFRRNE